MVAFALEKSSMLPLAGSRLSRPGLYWRGTPHALICVRCESVSAIRRKPEEHSLRAFTLLAADSHQRPRLIHVRVRRLCFRLACGPSLMEGTMSTAEIGTLVVIISVFLTFAVILGWASRHGG